MDIVDTRDTLLQWLQTCKTSSQINFFSEVVETYIVTRFATTEPDVVIYSAKAFLLEQMDIQLTLISQKPKS